MKGAGVNPDGERAELLHEASEAMRFEGEMLWRAQEFFVGFSATLLAIAFGILQVGADSRLRASAASFVAAVAGLIALLGQLVLCFQSFYYLRSRLVRNRLVIAAGGKTTPHLDYESRALTATWTNLGGLSPDDLQTIARDLLARGGVRWVFRITFSLLLVGALYSMWFFLPLGRPGNTEVASWAICTAILIIGGVWGSLWGFSIPWALREAAERPRPTSPEEPAQVG